MLFKKSIINTTAAKLSDMCNWAFFRSHNSPKMRSRLPVSRWESLEPSAKPLGTKETGRQTDRQTSGGVGSLMGNGHVTLIAHCSRRQRSLPSGLFSNDR